MSGTPDTRADIFRFKAELLAALGREAEAATVKAQAAALDVENADDLRAIREQMNKP
jgi:hypothetical protein